MKNANATGKRSSMTRRGFVGIGALAAGGIAAAGTTTGRARAEEAQVTGSSDAAQVLGTIKPALGRILHNPDICSGCRTCEIVCAIAHEGIASSELSRIQWTKDIMGACVTDIQTCRQCTGPECLAACPTGALHVDEQTGARVIDEETCIGCQTCLNACPVTPSRIRYNAEKNVCFKCDLCGGDPQCVKFCPMGALTASWIEIEDASEAESIFEVDLSGEARTFAHVETNTLELTEIDGGLQLHGVVWTSHATQFNIILAMFDVTADLYDANGELICSSDNSAHIEIPEMSSGEFTLTFATTARIADIGKVVVHVPGEYLTNAPQEGAE